MYLVAGEDYIPLKSSTLSFAIGSNDGSTACRNITIIDDDSFEKNETFYLTVTVAEENIRILEPSNILVTILDDEGNV